MDHHVLNFIRQFIPLSDEEANIIIQQNVFRHYSKNDVLLTEGAFAKECYFVVKGCVRSYYIKDGEERNTEFYFENQTIRPVSYQTHAPSAYYLACLEDCILSVGTEENNAQLLEQVPRLAELILKMNEQLLLQKTLEFDRFKNHNPEERYTLLLEYSPELLQRIPLYHLASYLGITQVSLSRIRSRSLAKKR